MSLIHRHFFDKLRHLVSGPAEPIMVNSGLGAVPVAVAPYIVAHEYGDGVLHKTVLKITALPITIVDAGANGAHGGVKVYDFPLGKLAVLGGSGSLTLTAGAGGISDTAVFDVGVGSIVAAVDNEELAATEQNLVNKIEGTLVGGTLAAAGSASFIGSAVELDGSSTAIDAFLNAAITAATCSSDDVLTITGTIVITWLNATEIITPADATNPFAA